MSETISNTVLYDVEFVSSTFTNQTINAGSAAGFTITAPTGKYVLGGGGTGPGVANVAQSGSFPSGSGSLPNIWTVDYINVGTTNVTINFTLYALCARVAAL